MWRRKGSALLNIGGDAACKVDPFDKPKLNWINCVRGGQRYRLQAQGDFCATATGPSFSKIFKRYIERQKRVSDDPKTTQASAQCIAKKPASHLVVPAYRCLELGHPQDRTRCQRWHLLQPKSLS